MEPQYLTLADLLASGDPAATNEAASRAARLADILKQGQAAPVEPPTTSQTLKGFLEGRPDLNIVGNIGEGARMLARPFLAARDSLAEGVDLAQRAGVADSANALLRAPYEAGKNIAGHAINTSLDWLRSTQQMPGAKATDLFVRPEGGDNADIIENTQSVNKDAPLSPLGAAGIGNPVSSLGRESASALARAGRPSESKNLPQNFSIRETEPDHFTAFSGDKEVGYLRLARYKDDIFAADRETDPAFQRRGVATALQDHVEQKIGRPLDRSEALTPEGEAFEASRSSRAEGLPTVDTPSSVSRPNTLLSDAGKRSSLPGMIANATERPTAGTTPTTARTAALERGTEALYGPIDHPYQGRDDIRALQDHWLDAFKHYREQKALAETGDPLAQRLVANMESNGIREVMARWEAQIDPARAQTYRAGLDAFDTMDRPFRLSANDKRSSLPGLAATAAMGREEKISGAAIKVGDQVFSGRTHFEALQNAIPGASEMDLSGAGLEKAFREKFGKTAELDGFVTNTGSFVSREKAKQIAEQSEGFKPSLSDRSAFTRDNLDAVSLEHFRAKQEGRKPWEKPVAETYHVDQGPGRTLPPEVLRGFDPETTGIKAGSSPAAQLEKVTPATEHGFDTNTVFYRGDDAAISEFDLSKAGSKRPPTYAQGIHLTQYLPDAKGYGKNVGEFYTRVKKPFVFNPDDLSSVREVFPQARFNPGGDGIVREQIPAFTQALRDRGYDAVDVYHYAGAKRTIGERIILDPANIRRRGDRSSGEASEADALKPK